MNKSNSLYLVSNNVAGNTNALYVMERESQQHSESQLLTYCFDSDLFRYLPANYREFFQAPSELVSCRDEFGKEYRGAELERRVSEAIAAYQEELPGFLEFCQETEEKFSEAEARLNQPDD